MMRIYVCIHCAHASTPHSTGHHAAYGQYRSFVLLDETLQHLMLPHKFPQSAAKTTKAAAIQPQDWGYADATMSELPLVYDSGRVGLCARSAVEVEEATNTTQGLAAAEVSLVRPTAVKNFSMAGN